MRLVAALAHQRDGLTYMTYINRTVYAATRVKHYHTLPDIRARALYLQIVRELQPDVAYSNHAFGLSTIGGRPAVVPARPFMTTTLLLTVGLIFMRQRVA